MRGLRDFGTALIVALLSIGLMFGALSISLVEFQSEVALASTDAIPPSPIPITPTSTIPPTFTQLPGTEIPTLTTSPTFTSIAQSSCPQPVGWVSTLVQPGETIISIADRYRVSREQLRSANCMLTDSLVSGTTLYVPSQATSTVSVCTPGAVGWIKTYVVSPGDNLFSIASNHYTTQTLMINVNCRVGTLIYPGELLWVPNVATRTPYPSPLPGSTVTPHPTDPLTETALPFTSTPNPTNTSTSTATKTVTPTQVSTQTVTATP